MGWSDSTRWSCRCSNREGCADNHAAAHQAHVVTPDQPDPLSGCTICRTIGHPPGCIPSGRTTTSANRRRDRRPPTHQAARRPPPKRKIPWIPLAALALVLVVGAVVAVRLVTSGGASDTGPVSPALAE